MERNLKEVTFENAIMESLISNGYQEEKSSNFDKNTALYPHILLDFVKDTQPKEWKRYCALYKKPEEQFIMRFCDVVHKSSKGVLEVLRKGFTDRGIKFFVVQKAPETDLNPTALANFERNVFTCTRQLYYSLSNKNSVDIVLFINGIPLVSMELKCEFTGQNTRNAMEQYRFTRSAKETIFEFKKRVLVHFAVDLQSVYMTTRLEGANTYFLPFNQGSNGSGNVGGSGNPINPNGFQTAYLWEDVLQQDRLLEIIHKYIHLSKKESKDKKTGKVKTSEALIFPRYHQLDVVTKLMADVKDSGAGKNYLIQHSAGSGKSNSIAWLAHRLSSLHNEHSHKIFRTVFVVTDRVVLDSQLQEIVRQFEQTDGVVKNIDKNSGQLRDAINDGVSIIVTTLFKFPVIYKEIQENNHNFAIIVDEAHSSTTGEAAKKLKKALGNTEAILEEYAKYEQEQEEQTKDFEDKMIDELASQGTLPNLSFFAFTATPKPKTLQLFGIQQEDETYKAYHTYSMRQAIEEGFILDVLANYMTYTTYYQIIKKIPDNPEFEDGRAMKAIQRYESLHPHNISQKVAVILEHFQNRTISEINGKAKAMIVTASRLHAVRYFMEMKKQINDRAEKDIRFKNIGVLVAFSGEVEDELQPGNETRVTEEKLNKTPLGATIKEDQLPEAFNSEDFHVLVVAEKYQTGFDEPLLHTMFVDKKLSGVKAVQTLSRLNRTTKGKTSTFVLDFVNTADDIRKAFEPYYEATILEEATSPNVIYDIKATLDDYNLYSKSELDLFQEIYFNSNDRDEVVLAKINACLVPVIERLMAIEDDERKNLFKSTVARFNRIYAFITQIYRLFDSEIHSYSIYLKYLQKLFPKGSYDGVDLTGKIELEYYRLEKTSEGSIKLVGASDGFRAITGETGSRPPQKSPLEDLIEIINERFKTNFTHMDKVFHQIQNDFLDNEQLVNLAKTNTEEDFKLIYNSSFMDIAAKRYEQNDEFFKTLFRSTEFLDMIKNTLRGSIYQMLRDKE